MLTTIQEKFEDAYLKTPSVTMKFTHTPRSNIGILTQTKMSHRDPTFFT